MSEKPAYHLSRSGNDITISILNRDGKETAIYRSDSMGDHVNSVSTINSDTFNETVTAVNVGYVLRFLEIQLSVTITEDHTDETPPYYVATALSGVTFTAGTANFNPSWDSQITYDIISVSGMKEGTKSTRKYTKA